MYASCTALPVTVDVNQLSLLSLLTANSVNVTLNPILKNGVKCPVSVKT